jgi:DNA invertase Pin-like site-specific DNA recombinase
MPPFAYLRKSVVRLDTPANSFEAQEAACRALAGLEGDADALVILKDSDISGRKGRDKRPGYDRLWRAIEDGNCSAVYSYSMSRLARNRAELLKLFDECRTRGIPVRLRADKIDTGSASGNMVAGVMASVAQFEADVAAERLQAAYDAKRDRGESLRTVPYYGEKEGEDAAAVLAAFREAGSYNGAARLLNERSVPTRRGRPWHASAVSVMIRRMDPSVGHHPRKGYKAGGTSYALASILRCGTCDKRLTGITSRTRGGTPYARYVCTGRNDTPHPRATVAEALILPAIKEEASHLRTPDTWPVEVHDQSKRAALEARRTAILDMREAGQINRAETDRRLAVVSDGLAKLDAAIELAKVPALDWTWPPKEINLVLVVLFERIDLDAATFQPLPDGYLWRVPEWRGA